MPTRRRILSGLTLAAATIAAATIAAATASAQSRPYPIVDTGQSQCYGSGYAVRMNCPPAGAAMAGQDAQYNTNPPQYRDNGDGTVTDLVTGLMWEKGFQRDVPWNAASSIAQRVNTGGHTDWRVPTIKELYSLMNFDGATGTMGPMNGGPQGGMMGRANQGFRRPTGGGQAQGGMGGIPNKAPDDAKPYLNAGIFDFEYPSSPQRRFIDAQYITATAYQGLTMTGNRTFFGVNFADGRIKGYPQTNPRRTGYYLRLVRGNPAYGKNAFMDNRDGTVTDRATGLSWMQADSGDSVYRPVIGQTHYKDGRMDWAEALDFCESLNLAGQTDWRLPNAKELQSIVDYSRSPQSSGSAALDPVFTITRITNEAGKPDFPAFWTSTSHLDGRNPGDHAVVVFFGEALGTMQNQMGGGGPGGMNSQMMGQGPMGGGFNRQGDDSRMRRPPPPGGQMGQMNQMGPPPGGMMGGPPPGGMPGGGMMGGGMQQGMQQGMGGPQQGNGTPTDVHGAGAQRSEPKTGNPSDYPKMGQGPQGDVVRVYNYARCVRGG